MIGAIVLTLRHPARREAPIDQPAGGALTATAHRNGGRQAGAGELSMAVGLPHYLAVAALLFTIGVFGIFINRKTSSSS
jgi:hypothetical protein